MKIANQTFAPEEIAFFIALILFFALIFFGAFQFSAEGRLFPLMLSTPALVLLAVFALRGYLPDRISEMLSRSDEFAIGTAGESETAEAVEGEEPETDGDVIDLKVYFIFAFTIVFALCGYLFGFYAAVVVAIALYVSQARNEMKIGLVGTILLTVGLIAVVYVFDTAFGYHFGRGALLSIPWF